MFTAVYRREDIDRVRAATNIVDLVGAVTTVKRVGRTYKAICPFHQEKTPSMSLDPARGLYHCFGCGAGGDVFTFVQESQGLDFNEAVELLASRAGIHVEADPTAAKRRGERERLVEAVRLAVDVYRRRLKTAPDAGPARAYLRGRGYGADVVDEFKIGYAPDTESRDELVRELRAAGIADRTMIDAGLARRGRGGRLYDYFRGRVLFPVFDLRGDPVGFGGRILGDGQPKYLNTPDTRIYQKSRLLYGLDRAKREIARRGYAVVVEGYTDVIAMHRAGLGVAVATCGTALGDEHFDLLRRFCDRVVLAFDADQAGAGAAQRADELENPVRLDLDVRVAEMPRGLDPADLVQEGRTEELVAAVESARPLLQFLIERELARFDLSEPESRARALRAVAPRIARVGDEVAKAEYVRFVAMATGIDEDLVWRAVGGRPRRRRREVAPESRGETSGSLRAERELLRLVVANPEHLAGVEISDELFADPTVAEAWRRVEGRRRDTPPGTALPLPVGDDPVTSLLRELAFDDRPLADPGELVVRLRRFRLDDRIAVLRERLATLDPSGREYAETFQELIRLEQEKRGGG